MNASPDRSRKCSSGFNALNNDPELYHMRSVISSVANLVFTMLSPSEPPGLSSNSVLILNFSSTSADTASNPSVTVWLSIRKVNVVGSSLLSLEPPSPLLESSLLPHAANSTSNNAAIPMKIDFLLKSFISFTPSILLVHLYYKTLTNHKIPINLTIKGGDFYFVKIHPSFNVALNSAG